MIVWHAQEHPASCVAACIRMVLANLGEAWTEAQVRQVIGHTRLGVALISAHAGLVQAGAAVEFHDDWNLADLRDSIRRNQYQIVGVERHPLGHPPASHAVVLVRVMTDSVEALDPLEGPQPQRYGVPAFELAWKLSGQEALTIESPPRRPSR
jgi:ABC-type bacteriocin/lantibiotic exporter with double-glycine peptidase domain